MATISKVNAKFIAKNPPTEQTDTKIRVYFGVFFDGTSNNMIQGEMAREYRENHKNDNIDGKEPNWWEQHIGQGRHSYEINDLTNKEAEELDEEKNVGEMPNGKGYSNVAILHSKYQGTNQGSEGPDVKDYIYKIYVEGSGANDIKEFKTGAGINGLGFGLGKTGVVALVSKAVKAVDMKLKAFGACKDVEVHFDIFGFSRGSACARLFAYLIAREKGDKLEKREYEFGKYYCKTLYNSNEKRLDKFLSGFEYKEKPQLNGKSTTIDFLGIYDTVVSIGLLRRKKKETKSNNYIDFEDNSVNPLKVPISANPDFWGNYHDLNVQEYGMFSPTLREGKINTFHICAMDEYRENFALTDIGEEVPENGLEIYLPGCHSDIGGGYICGAEDRTVLNKFPFQSLLKKENFDKNFRTIEDRKGLHPVQIYTIHPENGTGPAFVGWKTMQKLGWIPDFLNMSGTNFCTKEGPFIWRKKSRIEIKLAGDRHLLGNLIVHKFDWSEEKRKWIGTKSEEDLKAFLEKKEKDIVAIKGFLCYYEKTFKKQEGVQGNSTKGYVVNKGGEGEEVICEFQENSARFGMTRKVPLFFSNVPLHLMVNRSHKVVGRDLFKEELSKNEEFYCVPIGLGDFYNKINEYVEAPSNCKVRKWFYPGDCFDSLDYQKIRRNYLHFTSEQNIGLSRLWDVPNEHITKEDGYTLSDDKIMTRIIYHGDKDNYGNMRYMHQQKK